MNLDVKLGGKYYLQTCNRWVGIIKTKGTEKEYIIRAFEQVQQTSASQEELLQRAAICCESERSKSVQHTERLDGTLTGRIRTSR
jgi:hypothetical protein